MSERHKVDSKEVGLVIGLILGKHLFGSEDMHYGLWADGLAVTARNLPAAQEKHSDFIISNIPDGVETVLDVGCGVGVLAKKLTARGYQVDCVSPSPLLTERARANLGESCEIFACEYEKLETDKKYDLIMFSESFQYVNLKKSLKLSEEMLKDGGHILICDFFRTDAPGKSALGGGHRLARFYEVVARHPFRQVKDIDITREIAPTMDLVHDLLTNVGIPMRDLIDYFMESNYPRWRRMIKWRFRKRFDKLNRKYFSGDRDAKHFAIFKSYRLLLYQKDPALMKKDGSGAE